MKPNPNCKYCNGTGKVLLESGPTESGDIRQDEVHCECTLPTDEHEAELKEQIAYEAEEENQANLQKNTKVITDSLIDAMMGNFTDYKITE